MSHVLACAGHFWCNEATRTANFWVIPLTIATFIGIVIVAAIIRGFTR